MARLPALSHPDFRNFVLGSFVSNLGGQLQTWAIAWHLYQITGSNLAVGTIGLIRVVPLLLLGLFGGVVADQVDRRTVLIWSQALMAIVALGLSFFTHIGHATVGVLYAVVGLGAVSQAFAGPSRQAMVANLVPAAHYPNAASINGIQWRLSDVLGPALAGVLIGSGPGGLSLCYLFNSVSFVALIFVVWLLPRRPPDPALRASSPKAVLHSIRDGFRFVRSTKVLGSAMWIDFWGTFLSGAQALLPAFATHVLALGPRGYGILASSSGAGALLASIALAWMPTIRRQGRWVIAMIAFYGLFTVLFGLSRTFLSAALFYAATGAADMISTVLRQTIRQLATPDPMRGRMSSISMLFNVTGPQLGDFEAGALATLTTVRTSIIAGGLGCAAITAWFWSRARALKEYRHLE